MNKYKNKTFEDKNILPNTKYYYKVFGYNNSGIPSKEGKILEVTTPDVPLEIKDIKVKDTIFNSANNEVFKIAVKLKNKSIVKITVYNILGNQVKEIVNSDFNSGIHVFEWDGCNDNGQMLGSGGYLIYIETTEFKHIRKVVILK